MKNKTLVIGLSLALAACATKANKVDADTAQSDVIAPVEAEPVNDDQAQPTPAGYSESQYSHYDLLISIKGGEANFNNVDGYASYTPVTFSLKSGEKKSIPIIKAGKNFFDSKTVLTAYLNNGVLSLDTTPSPFALHHAENPDRTIPFTTGWLQGKTYYNISTHGQAGLNNTTVTLHLMSS